MRESDIGTFMPILDDVAALLRPGQAPLTGTAKAMYFRALAAYPIEEVQAAFDAHVKDPQRGRFMPLPADLIAQISGASADDGRPGAEEAWAIALAARDEAATVVWTAETAQAWQAARPVMAVGDEVGARMAFREAYGRLVAEARAGREPAAWTASLGFDTQQRQVALDAAVQAGRLPAHDAMQLTAPVSAPLLAMAESFGAPPHVIASLRELADKLRNQGLKPSADVLAKADTQQRQAEMAERVATYVGGSGQEYL